IKYALLIPLVLGMLIYTSCDTSETEVVEQEASVLEQIEGLKTTMEKNGGLTDEERAELLKLWLKTKDGNSELVLGENYYAEIKDESVEESIEVPYSVVEKAPVFPGCETSLDNGAQKACFNAKMMEHVVANFNRNLAKEAGLTGVQKISVFFKIDANGNIIDAKARAPHPKLEEEALRVVGLLPKMTPATQRGKQVTVPYYLPIKFEAQ